MKKITRGSSRNQIFWKNFRISWSRCTDFLTSCMCAKLFQLCPTLCDLVDWYLPGSSVHGILQASILKWVAISSSRGSSWPRDLNLPLFCLISWQALYHSCHLGSPLLISYLYQLLKGNWIIILHTILLAYNKWWCFIVSTYEKISMVQNQN